MLDSASTVRIYDELAGRTTNSPSPFLLTSSRTRLRFIAFDNLVAFRSWSILRYDSHMEPGSTFHATTILCVRRDGKVAMAGDGQVTVGNTVMKQSAAKVRRLYEGRVLAGFAGAAADAFALFARFEAKLDEYQGNMERAVVELAKDWRLDKYLRQLQALLIVANDDKSYLVSGTGDVIVPDDGLLAIGSGGPYALAAARALTEHTNLSAAEVAKEGLLVAASICIYTNDNITIEEL